MSSRWTCAKIPIGLALKGYSIKLPLVVPLFPQPCTCSRPPASLSFIYILTTTSREGFAKLPPVDIRGVETVMQKEMNVLQSLVSHRLTSQ